MLSSTPLFQKLQGEGVWLSCLSPSTSLVSLCEPMWACPPLSSVSGQPACRAYQIPVAISCPS
ncbi:hypothetical protein RRG08_050885 [Elysia crispata]|uniref:Uncharacterized protein n=1 Tax=Elysia crispata TaxID=231223 RepID=A0AAE1DFB9_9GAST|nr:hypothetical protein RRG08_050885 [Elysia crispata]